ncbi:MAG: general secretion pathway protein GspK [Gemmatimonadaceae bacterium]
MNRARDGFTMITVLWVMTVAAVVAAAGALHGRDSVNAAINRLHLDRAFWLATACVSRAESAIDARLASAASLDDAAAAWRVLGRVVPPMIVADPACTITLEAAGTRLDVNGASEEMLENLFAAIGRDDAVDLASSLADWRDSDDVARPGGAERDWYASTRRDLPRNGPLADLRELRRVRGFEQPGTFDSVFTTEPGRVSLATAPVSVLLAVPGFTRETADQLVALEEAGTPVPDVLSVLGLVSKASADSLRARYPDIVRVTTPDPDAWLLAVRASVGAPAVSVTLVRRLLRGGRRAVVVGARSYL